jgi:hypothetical protein
VKFGFVDLPGEVALMRAAVPIVVERLARAPQMCLLDTGSVRNIFPGWLAEELAIEFGDAEEKRLGIAGMTTTARCAHTSLRLGPWMFDAPVWFADPWPFGFAVLGQEGFFVYFRVTLCALEGWLECEPEAQAPVRSI